MTALQWGASAWRSLQGAVDILFARPKALENFDFSVSGFWASFGAVVFLLPPFAVSAIAEAQLSIMLADGDHDGFPWGSFIVARLVALVLDWLTFPALLAVAARPLGIGGHYAGFIIVRNWASVVSAAIFVIPEVLLSFGIVGTDGWLLLSLIALVGVMIYHYRVVRLTLLTPAMFSVGMVLVDFLISIGVSELVDRLIGP